MAFKIFDKENQWADAVFLKDRKKTAAVMLTIENV